MEDNRIVISLPADMRWMRLAQDSLARYSEIVGFSQSLKDMCASSVMEACEELVRRADEAGIADPIDLRLDFKGETLIVDITYNRHIPLNPHETVDYELPDTDTDLDQLDMDVLWLHIIKRRMDRVRFMVKGPKHVLRMVKYRRDKGREKQAWVMVIKPELRKGLVLHLEDTGTEHPGSTLQAPGAGVLKLGPSETFLIRNMDGKTSFHDLYMAHIDTIGLISPNTLALLYERLEAMGMLAPPENAPGKKRFRQLLRKLITPEFTIPNADSIVTAVHRRTRFLYSRPGLLLLLAIGLSGLMPFIENRTRFMQVIMGLEETFMGNPTLLLPVYLLMILHVCLHELGHGVACKHYGGHVPRMGIMFYLASFIFYCDTTAAWNFPEKKHRILVSLAGPVVSFAILGTGLWGAGTVAGTGTAWEPVLILFSLFNFFSLAMNFNPFIKMDAYYMLLDHTGIPNLRLRSFKFLERKTLGWLGMGKAEDAKATLRERRIFWWYGYLGTLVTVVFIAVPILRLFYLLRTGGGPHEKLLLAILIAALVLIRLGNIAFRKTMSLRYREYKIQ